MTDREPDDLYDALRDRLADYGQEPPAPLWAGIRAQLPPPVAQPKLRRRRRAGLLALLLLVVSVGSWQWWHMGHENLQPGTEIATVNPSSSSHSASTTPATTLRSASATEDTNATAAANETAGHHAQTSHQSGAEATGASAIAPAEVASIESGKALKTIAAAKPAVGSESRNGKLVPGRATKNAAVAAGRESTGLVATSASTAGRQTGAFGAAKSRFSVETTGRIRTNASRKPAASAVGTTAGIRPNGQPANNGEAALLAANARQKRLFGKSQSRSTTVAVETATAATAETDVAARLASTPGASNNASQNADKAQSDRNTEREAGLKVQALAVEATSHSAKDTDLAADAFASPSATEASVPAAPGSFVAWSLLQPRPVALALLPWATPTVLPVADTVPHLPAVAARRWAVQVLAGPALTYRQLGSEGVAATAPVPNGVATSVPTNYFDQRGSATSTVQHERPALGFGAQVQLRRVLNGRWAVSAGLGYQEYATSLAFQTVKAVAGAASPVSSVPHAPDSTTTATTFHLRNTYRLLSVPVRFSYQLGVGGRRFRAGVLVGAEAALYLGGATAEKSSCGCQTETWGATGSPYRPLSLALSLGLDLRYRLAPRWELLAQPTATGFITSLARPSSGLPTRYLLGGGALLGVAYELK